MDLSNTSLLLDRLGKSCAIPIVVRRTTSAGVHPSDHIEPWFRMEVMVSQNVGAQTKKRTAAADAGQCKALMNLA